MTRSSLVMNEAKTAPNPIQRITANFAPPVRYEEMEGKRHIVVPVVMMTEGVHAGSSGPLFYPVEELSKTPAVWNYKPIVVYHPEENGEGISACDPTIISSRKIGVIMHANWDGKLKAEAWIEEDRANLVDDRIMQAIENKQMMELSTGLFTDNEDDPGDWNGETYVGIARNYRPDHLALLPDKKGACSIEDGAGFLRLNELARTKRTIMDTLQRVENQLSHSNVHGALADALRKRFTGNKELWVEDVFDDFVVFDRDGKLSKLGYTKEDDAVTLSDKEPLEVVRVTEYRTVDGSFVGNTGKESQMNKKEFVDGLIANGKWEEKDRDFLMGLEETQLKKMEPEVKEVVKEVEVPAKTEKKVENAAAEGATEVAPEPVTVESYVGNAPPEIQEVLTNGLSSFKQEKSKLISVIKTNQKNSFTDEQLQKMGLADLRSLAKLAAPEKKASSTTALDPDYSGLGEVQTNEDAEEPMAAPTMNFEK